MYGNGLIALDAEAITFKNVTNSQDLTQSLSVTKRLLHTVGYLVQSCNCHQHCYSHWKRFQAEYEIDPLCLNCKPTILRTESARSVSGMMFKAQ